MIIPTRWPNSPEDVNSDTLPLLFAALCEPQACYVLGAGASTPIMPLTADIAEYVARGSIQHVSGFPAGPLPRTQLHRLIEESRTGWDTRSPFAHEFAVHWKIKQFTDASIVVALAHQMARPLGITPPQYAIFQSVPRSATIVNFNWDLLALRSCPQQRVIHPHGRFMGRSWSDDEFHDLLFTTQELRTYDARRIAGAGLVWPGEESELVSPEIREAVADVWRRSPVVVVIGYSFGIGSEVDRIWRDVFVDCCGEDETELHLVGPAAGTLAGELGEFLGRVSGIHTWPYRWDAFSRAMLATLRSRNTDQIEALFDQPIEVLRRYNP